jgi:cell division transport system permease protein
VKGYGFLYFITEAFHGLRANRLVNLLAVGTISMAMLIVGFFLLVFINLHSAVNALGDRLEISVYLKEGVTAREKDFLRDRLNAEPGVKRVTYLAKADALALFQKQLTGQEKLLEGLGENPLPDSYEAAVDRQAAAPDRLEAMAKKFAAYPGVEDVSYGKEGAQVLSGLYEAVLYGGVALSVLLGVSVVFIISNSVRLALYSRGQEIELMQWIGATRGFIQGPFLIEGMMLAMLGSALSVGVIAALYFALPQELVLILSRAGGLDFLPPSVVACMIIGGGLLGLSGALVSVAQFLE